MIFGTLATFLGVLGAVFLKKHPFLVALPTILSNAFIIPLVLRFAYDVPDTQRGSIGNVPVTAYKKHKLL